MSDALEHLQQQWLYEAISDPDCTGWNCPTCGYCNYHALGLKECERCAYELDQDRVRDALKERETNAAINDIKARQYECFIEDHQSKPWTPGQCAGYAGRTLHLMRCKRRDGHGLALLFCRQHAKGHSP
jgi:hypothetical protein